MTGIALLISLGAVAWLARHDPKRRRSFGLAPATPRISARFVWFIALAPGGILAVLGEAASVFLWMGGVSAFGWGIVAISPAAYRRWLGTLSAWAAALRARIGLFK